MRWTIYDDDWFVFGLEWMGTIYQFRSIEQNKWNQLKNIIINNETRKEKNYKNRTKS